MTPEQLALPGTEHAHQVALFAWCALNIAQYPELKWFHSIPNGGSRGDTAKSRSIEGGKMKAEGVKKGIPDTFLPIPRGIWKGLYIELKKPDGKPSDEQKEFADFAKAQGYGHVFCYSWIEARDMLVCYLQYPKYGEVK